MHDETQNTVAVPESHAAPTIDSTSVATPTVGDAQAPVAQPFSQLPASAPEDTSPSPMPVTAAMSAQPVASAPSTGVSEQGSQVLSQTVVTMQPKSRRPKLLLVGGLGFVAALLVAGGYVFGFYLPNRPENVFRASLSNTALGIDRLLDYGKQQNAASYKGMAYDGTLTVKSPASSFDASLTGSADTTGNSSTTLNGDIMGDKLTIQMRTISAHEGATPDVYLQANGLKQLLASSGLGDMAGGLSGLDGQWLSIDHTLVDTYAAQLNPAGGARSSQSALAVPTYAQFADAARKMQAVNEQYLFTTDSTHAVLAQEKFVGQEVADGHTLDHYTVSYNKTHFAAYIDALKNALDSSSLNGWSTKANDGKSLSAALDLDGLKNDVTNAKSGYTFDLWADTRTRLVSKVAFKNPDGANSVFAMSQGYVGGSSYPLSMTFNGKDDSGNDQNAIINFSLDTTSHKITVSMAMTSKASDGTTQVNLSLHATPSADAVQVSVPAGATSINNVLQGLGLGGLGSGSLPLSSADTPLVLQQ